jgi:hypothetical protein
MAVPQGDFDLRAEEWRRDLVGFAMEKYTLIEDITVKGTSSWINHYYQETAAALTGTGTRTVKGLGRGSELPFGGPTWTLNDSYMQKYGLKSYILYEDAISDNIDVVGRTLAKVAEGVVNSVEDEIFDVITESQSAVNTLTTASTAAWDAGSGQHPVKDILIAMRKIAAQNYTEIYKGAGALWLSPLDYQSLLVFVYDKGAQGPKFGEMILADGRVQQTFLGLRVRISNSVKADFSVVLVRKRCATWVELEPLRVRIEDHSPKDYEISAWQFGKTQLTDPKCVHWTSNTQT